MVFGDRGSVAVEREDSLRPPSASLVKRVQQVQMEGLLPAPTSAEGSATEGVVSLDEPPGVGRPTWTISTWCYHRCWFSQLSLELGALDLTGTTWEGRQPREAL